ncbi:hypothetical protein EA462_15490 [Natrarchaeobius halalkaliphilus]|uniref:Uncharacterized protein n=1 Tax=Natrarchaeobius halalkaliphilus TaxID=1679091 RepID=A0A3N6LZ54_9EURY|nr:hypothetical protein [Natrarchaeobius halalkaliphilus]RQG87042.1 hypothetical protein EA462_15490 [Natrarchaeobius halalkaliphilus]
MTNPPAVLNEKTLAATYDGGYHENSWEVVKQYRKAIKYASKHNAGSSATASALEIPRGRLRTWIDGDGKPDPVRGIETARDYGWLECSYEDSVFAGLNVLVANVFSGGSIAEQYYQPSFALNHRKEDSHVFDAFELAGIECEIIDDRGDHGDEVRPAEHGTVLGRTLSSLGAPVGSKSNHHLELPEYLGGAPETVRERFVYAYLENRAIKHDKKQTLTVREDRNRAYLNALADLIDDVAGGGVSLQERDIVISADASRLLGTVR